MEENLLWPTNALVPHHHTQKLVHLSTVIGDISFCNRGRFSQTPTTGQSAENETLHRVLSPNWDTDITSSFPKAQGKMGQKDFKS